MKKNALIMSWGVPAVLRNTQRGLKAIGWDSHIVMRGAAGGQSWVRDAVQYIKDARPAFVFSWQRLYGEARPIWRAARDYGARLVIMDFGLWPHYWTAMFDPRGENRESALVGAFDDIEADPAQRQYIDEQRPVVDEIARAIERSAAEAPRVLGKLKGGMPKERNFVFLALQRCARGRPDKVLELDAVPARRHPLDIAKAVIAEAEKQNTFVVLKQHFQGINLDGVLPQRGPYHHLIPMFQDRQENGWVCGWCIRHCSHLVTVNSTTWSQALALGKPAACMGRGWFSHNNIVKECRLVREALPTPEPAGERGKRFVALMISRQCHQSGLRRGALRKPLHRIYPDAF